MTQDQVLGTTMLPGRGPVARRRRFGGGWRSAGVRAPVGLLLMFCALVLQGGFLSAPLAAQDTDAPTVYVVPIQGTIEPGIGHFLERSLNEAEEAGAELVILDIETPGGRLDTVLQMRDAILASPMPVVAYVNRDAFSAGALITIAADQIWMAPGAVFGAATPVIGGSGETASEKTISAVRSTFASTAEENGRDPAVAEAMVDPAVSIDGLVDSTSLLTLTVDQAEEWGYLDGVAEDRASLIGQLGYSDAAVKEMSISPIEQLVRWITDPVFSSLLILLGLFLIVADALFAGFGIAAVAGVACLGLFFWGYALAGLAGWEDLLLVVIGLALIAVEIFVIPGFGVAGVLGLGSLVAGLVLAMTGRDFGNFELTDEVIRAGWTVAISLALVVVAMIVAILVMPSTSMSSRRIGGLALGATVDAAGRAGPAVKRKNSGWLMRRFGGEGVLEEGDVHMPEPGGKPGHSTHD